MPSERVPAYYTVPAGAKGKPCKAAPICDATIYLIKSPRNPQAWIPIDCNVERGALPTATEHGRGVNHYETCKDPNRFRRAKPPAPRQAGQAGQRELPVNHTGPRACIFCGCSPGARCVIPKIDLDPIEQDIQVGRHDVNGPADLPETVPCYFIQIEPPICSKPDCKARRQTELPLRMRVSDGASS